MQIPHWNHSKSRYVTGSFFKRTAASIVLVTLLGVILIALAVLQYRWSGQVSEAEHERMHASLLTAMNQFRAQFQSEFQRIAFLFQPDMTVLNQEDWQSYAANCENVLSNSDLHLVRGVLLWVANERGEDQLYQLNRMTRRFEIKPWPSELEPVRARHMHLFQEPFPSLRGPRPFERLVNLDRLLMMCPLIRIQPSPNRPTRGFLGFVMLQLNPTVLMQEVFPELARRCFGGSNGFVYHVAVISRQAPARLLYASDLNSTVESFAKPDAQIRLMENARDRFGPGMPNEPNGSGRSPGPREPAGPPERGGPRDFARPERPRAEREQPIPPELGFRPEPAQRAERLGILQVVEQEGPAIEVVAIHREGSLDAAVARSRYRNLAVSFGILLLLAISMTLVLVFARRSQRLAKLQIDFVAGVSHELRTPLAVICSAGDNLADGIVSGSGASARQYGELIRSEARRLTAMIEQVLQFASIQSGRLQYNFSHANLNDIVLKAIDQSKPGLETAGFSVDILLDENLPAVFVDPDVLSHVIQNLIQNALKYSGESRWMMIRTEKIPTKRGAEIRLSVEDKGMGIDHEDLSHIFEPFYRGSAASAAQIHGTGLGLFMVRQAIVSMGGTITVKSTRGKGSIFALHLPGSPVSAASLTSGAGKGNQNHAV